MHLDRPFRALSVPTSATPRIAFRDDDDGEVIKNL
jgi:hypothetical protein